MDAYIFHRVIEHLEPNPKLYLRLSLVSKYYYSWFTSDRLWQSFNVYNLEEGIYKHYLESEKDYIDGENKRMSSLYWSGLTGDDGLRHKLPGSDMRYAWLGYLVSLKDHDKFPEGLELPHEDWGHLTKYLVRLRPSAMAWAKRWLQNDREFAIELVGRAGCQLKHFGVEIRGDIVVVRRAISTGCNRYCGCRFPGTRLAYASPALRQNDELVKYAVDRDWRSLRFASREFRQDPDVVQAALKQSPNALEFCEYQPRDLVMAAVQRNGVVIKYAPNYTNDREIMMIAVTTCISTFALSFASTTLKGDKELVMAAVKCHGNQLEFASRKLRGYRAIVLAAVLNRGTALAFASKELRNDRAIAIAVVAKSGANCLEYASEELLRDKAFLYECIRVNVYVLEYINRFFSNYEDYEKAIEINPRAIFYIPSKYKEDRRLAQLAVRKNSWLVHDLRRPSWWDQSSLLKQIARRGRLVHTFYNPAHSMDGLRYERLRIPNSNVKADGGVDHSKDPKQTVQETI